MRSIPHVGLTSASLEGTARENTYGCAPKDTREGALKVVLETRGGLGGELGSGPGPDGETLSPPAIQEGRMYSTPQASPAFLASYLNSAGGPANRCSVGASERKGSSHSPCPLFLCPLKSSRLLGHLHVSTWRPQYSRGRNSLSEAFEGAYCETLGGWLPPVTCRGKRRLPEGQVALGAHGASRSAGTSVDSAPSASPALKQPVEGGRESEVEARSEGVGGGEGAGLTQGPRQHQQEPGGGEGQGQGGRPRARGAAPAGRRLTPKLHLLETSTAPRRASRYSAPGTAPRRRPPLAAGDGFLWCGGRGHPRPCGRPPVAPCRGASGVPVALGLAGGSGLPGFWPRLCPPGRTSLPGGLAKQFPGVP